jgi:hypothetical protein
MVLLFYAVGWFCIDMKSSSVVLSLEIPDELALNFCSYLLVGGRTHNWHRRPLFPSISKSVKPLLPFLSLFLSLMRLSSAIPNVAETFLIEPPGSWNQCLCIFNDCYP